ncbi:hypothetical protein GCM10022254_06770 [Actinomadura meridiana]|uniref:Uncharacterized protein n=1 Tax=Actinomadura meridiana TaxID=559626 RepID=A0ABP8BSY1_9ACTN
MNGPPELGVELVGIEAGTSAVTPTLDLRVALRRLDGGPVQCVLLTTTVTIAPSGPTWARAGATVPTFRGRTEVTFAVPRGHDRWDGHAPHDDAVPLGLAFDGTVFYPAGDGTRHTGQAPWRHETTALLPARAWRDLMVRDGRREVGILREEPTA